MPFVPSVCTQCGSPIQVDNTKEAGICPHCGTAFVTEKVINNYVTNHVSNTTVTQNITKIINGREKTEAEEYNARGLTYLGLGEYNNATDCFLQSVKTAPGDIENHILLMRAQTLDFRTYYLQSETAFERIQKLAKLTDITPFQKQYGYTFAFDKEYCLKSYRMAVDLYKKTLPQQDELARLGVHISDPSLCEHIANIIKVLPIKFDFTQSERREFFKTYIADFTSPQTGVLQVLNYRIFPQTDGRYDFTSHDGPIFFSNPCKDTEPPKFLLNTKNIGPGSNIIKCDAHIVVQGVFDVANIRLSAQNLSFTEGVTEIVNSENRSSSLSFEHVKFPDSLVRIGSKSIYMEKADAGSIQFGKGLKRIEDSAFESYKTSNLTTDLVLPENMEYVGKQAFGRIYARNVVFSAGLQGMGTFPFESVGFVICLCDTKKFPVGWNYYIHNSRRLKTTFKNGKMDSVDFVDEKTNRVFNYFDSVSNTVYCDTVYFTTDAGTQTKITIDSPDADKAAFLRYLKKYCDFDESKTKFIDSKKVKTEPITLASAPIVRGGCYIATAVYGSYDCPPVWTLRRYRDFSLRRTAPGRLFVKLYYAVSPALVKLFGKRKWFCSLCKKALDKKVNKLRARGFEDTPYNDR